MATQAKKVKTAARRATVDLGISAEANEIVVNILRPLVADEMILYTKLRNYHWNVTGPEFKSLHALFEEQYEEVADIIDQLAERIRQHGEKTPGTLAEFKEMARLSEEPGVYPAAMTMVANLEADHEALVRQLRADIETIDDEADEVGAEDLLTGMLQQHQKMAWMLRAHLEK